MKYTPTKITDDGSQLLVKSDVGQIAVDLKAHDTPDKVKAEILRTAAILSPAAIDPGLGALVGVQVTLTAKDITDEQAKQEAEKEAAAEAEAAPVEALEK